MVRAGELKAISLRGAKRITFRGVAPNTFVGSVLILSASITRIKAICPDRLAGRYADAANPLPCGARDLRFGLQLHAHRNCSLCTTPHYEYSVRGKKAYQFQNPTTQYRQPYHIRITFHDQSTLPR